MKIDKELLSAWENLAEYNTSNEVLMAISLYFASMMSAYRLEAESRQFVDLYELFRRGLLEAKRTGYMSDQAMGLRREGFETLLDLILDIFGIETHDQVYNCLDNCLDLL